jgi:deoxyhypusine monooxygenase
MFERYRAMFALRNRGDTEAVLALAAGFADASAVFRHEIAYVMGQLQHKAAVPSLTKALIDTNEHAMVRHEAAEALGSIGEEESSEVLAKFQRDNDRIVRYYRHTSSPLASWCHMCAPIIVKVVM